MSSNDVKNKEASSGSDLSAENVKPKEPSLGPACLVVAILSLAVFFAVCAFGSWMMFADQYKYAEPAITDQLIPYVEQSTLATEDRESILLQLEALLPKIRNKEIDTKQLYRLRNCLTDNPVLLWGVVQSVLSQAQKLSVDSGAGSDGMTAVELEALNRIERRMLRAAADRKIGRNDLELTLQSCAVLAKDQSGLEVKPDLTPTQIREFMTRSEQLINRVEQVVSREEQVNKQTTSPIEPYEKTPADAFEALIRSALELE
ncbi:MAG: hypothetical protein SFV81_29620 [Pirellulaceae bacterium]|nr:hypothetical protein [Pirellulaceae bacterium]